MRTIKTKTLMGSVLLATSLLSHAGYMDGAVKKEVTEIQKRREDYENDVNKVVAGKKEFFDESTIYTSLIRGRRDDILFNKYPVLFSYYVMFDIPKEMGKEVPAIASRAAYDLVVAAVDTCEQLRREWAGVEQSVKSSAQKGAFNTSRYVPVRLRVTSCQEYKEKIPEAMDWMTGSRLTGTKRGLEAALFTEASQDDLDLIDKFITIEGQKK